MTLRRVLTVFDYLRHAGIAYETTMPDSHAVLPEWSFSDGDYEAARARLYDSESRILRVLGYDTRVALPYRLCINYLQALDVLGSSKGSNVARRAVSHLNSALLSPQLLYLTHQPSAIATAAIYLSAREGGIALPNCEWWEVFDVDREELGFLVVALQSVQNFAREEVRRWEGRQIPLTVEATQRELSNVNS